MLYLLPLVSAISPAFHRAPALCKRWPIVAKSWQLCAIRRKRLPKGAISIFTTLFAAISPAFHRATALCKRWPPVAKSWQLCAIRGKRLPKGAISVVQRGKLQLLRFH